MVSLNLLIQKIFFKRFSGRYCQWEALFLSFGFLFLLFEEGFMTGFLGKEIWLSMEFGFQFLLWLWHFLVCFVRVKLI